MWNFLSLMWNASMNEIKHAIIARTAITVGDLDTTIERNEGAGLIFFFVVWSVITNACYHFIRFPFRFDSPNRCMV